jgi:probable blue pigment (indigoidine) exporter
MFQSWARFGPMAAGPLRAWLARPATVGLLLLAGVILAWGSGPLAVDRALAGGMGPLWLAATRLLVAGSLVLIVARLRGRPVGLGRAWVRVGLTGLLGWSVGNGLQVVAQQDVPSSVAALLLGLSPALAVLLDAAWARRWPGLCRVIGVVAGLVGLVWLVGGGGLGLVGPWPVLLLLLAALGWGAAAVWEARSSTAVAPSVSAGWQMLSGGLGLGLSALALGEPLPLATAEGWGAWAWLTLVCGALGFLGWVEVLRRVPVPLAMTQPGLSTLVAVGLGAAFLGERLGPEALPGVGLVLLGAGLSAVPPRPRGPRMRLSWPRRRLRPVALVEGGPARIVGRCPNGGRP